MRRARSRLQRAQNRRSEPTHRRAEERHCPVRTCIGCGRKVPKDELVRFVAEHGELVAAPSGPGRAAYTCRRLSCFERAVSRNAFSRTLRSRVRVDQKYAGLYT